MKKIIILIVVITANIVFGQHPVNEPIYPLGTSPFDGIPSGYYVKDIFNEYDKYIGTWEGTFNNKKFTLVIEKREHQQINFYDTTYFSDELVAKYEWIDLLTNSVLYSTMNVVNYEDFKITSAYKPRSGTELKFFYSDEFCGNTIEIDTNLSNNDTTMKFFGYYGIASEGFNPTNCPYTRKIDIPVPFPMNGITLHKL